MIRNIICMAVGMSLLGQSAHAMKLKAIDCVSAKDLELFHENRFNTYNGRQLTSDVILEEAPRLPDEEYARLERWLTDNPELVQCVIVQEFALNKTADIKEAISKISELFARQGICNLARSNYVFEDSSGRYVLKIANIVNRLYRKMVSNGLPPYHIFPIDSIHRAQMFDDVLPELMSVNTCQTVGCIPVYLRYRMLQRLRSLEHVAVPETFLQHVPGRPVELSDKNYVIVQARVDRPLQFKKDAMSDAEIRALHMLSPEQIQELVLFIFYCGIWNVNTNLYMTPDGKLGFDDLEEPNTTADTTADGKEVFYLQDVKQADDSTALFTRLSAAGRLKGAQRTWPACAIAFGKERYKRNVESGIDELCGLFCPDAPQITWIKDCARRFAAKCNAELDLGIDLCRFDPAKNIEKKL